MLTRFIPFAITISCALVWSATSICLAQGPLPVAISNFRLSEKAIFNRIGPATDSGQPVVKLLPAQDKQEVAVCGLVYVRVLTETFLRSFRESMVRKRVYEILDIGKVSIALNFEVLQNITIDPSTFAILCSVGL